MVSNPNIPDIMLCQVLLRLELKVPSEFSLTYKSCTGSPLDDFGFLILSPQVCPNPSSRCYHGAHAGAVPVMRMVLVKSLCYELEVSVISRGAEATSTKQRGI